MDDLSIFDFLDTCEDTDPLPHDTQRELVRRWQEDQEKEALRRLVRTNIGFLIEMSSDYFDTPHFEEGDILAWATKGMLKAADRYDLEQDETTFLTYAGYWVYKELQETAVDRDVLLTLDSSYETIDLKKHASKYDDIKQATRELDVDPHIGACYKGARRPMPIEPPPDEEDEASLLEMLPSEPEAPEKLDDLDVSKLFREFGNELSPLEKFVWYQRVRREEPTLEDVSEPLVITKERVRQIQDDLESRFENWVKQRVGR